ncbi:hypothetical protein MKW94_019940, partial [Papaver nudicaule]|nr:hypothetical protein [Papaver nudicaule]
MANSNEGFLTEGQRELLKIATENAENLSSSPKSPTSLLSDHIKVSTGPKAPTVGFASRHVRRSHSGKLGRAKKGYDALGFVMVSCHRSHIIICWSMLEDVSQWGGSDVGACSMSFSMG